MCAFKIISYQKIKLYIKLCRFVRPNASSVIFLMHLSSAFPGWGTPGIPGGIATFYIKVIQFSEPSGMIRKQSLHPGEIRNMLTKPHANRDNGSHPLTPENVPNPRARKRPRRPERPRYWGALFFNFSRFPPGSPGVPLPGKADDKCII